VVRIVRTARIVRVVRIVRIVSYAIGGPRVPCATISTTPMLTLDFPVRHVVPSSTGRRVILAAFERDVVIHDLVDGSRSGVIKTTFDFGGRRLALSDEVDGLLAAAYQIRGLALYCAKSGREIWRRKDLKRIQKITLSRDGLTAYCGVEEASLVAVDVRSGDTKFKMRAAESVYDSPFDPIKVVEIRRPIVRDTAGRQLERSGRAIIQDDAGKPLFRLRRESGGTLDATFAPGLFFLAEVGGPLRCFDLRSGAEKWRYQNPEGSHYLHIGYCGETHTLFGIEWPYEHGGPKTLRCHCADDGEFRGSRDLGEAVTFGFALGGKVLVTSDGEVRALRAGV
jgi:outer membrane protein assembly factor BamB